MSVQTKIQPAEGYTDQVMTVFFSPLPFCLCRVSGVTTAAVCVYPSRVADAVTSLKTANSGLPVASGKSLYTHSLLQHK